MFHSAQRRVDEIEEFLVDVLLVFAKDSNISNIAKLLSSKPSRDSFGYLACFRDLRKIFRERRHVEVTGGRVKESVGGAVSSTDGLGRNQEHTHIDGPQSR